MGNELLLNDADRSSDHSVHTRSFGWSSSPLAPAFDAETVETFGQLDSPSDDWSEPDGPDFDDADSDTDWDSEDWDDGVEPEYIDRPQRVTARDHSRHGGHGSDRRHSRGHRRRID